VVWCRLPIRELKVSDSIDGICPICEELEDAKSVVSVYEETNFKDDFSI
jgi:hypothetical protein